MFLILDHINGDNTDHRLENLRILCPNCSATLPTHGDKNIKNKKYQYFEKNNKQCNCGNSKSKKSKYCSKCNNEISQRKIKRPSYQQLIFEINELDYSGTGRKYSVSDNAIRKWKKYYEIHNTPS